MVLLDLKIKIFMTNVEKNLMNLLNLLKQNFKYKLNNKAIIIRLRKMIKKW